MNQPNLPPPPPAQIAAPHEQMAAADEVVSPQQQPSEVVEQTPQISPAADEKYKIENISGFDVLKVRIERPDESIYVKYDGQMVIDNSLKMQAVTGSKKGVFSGFWASASTGSVFINKIFLDPSAGAPGIVHISGIFPGSITEIDIQPGQSWLVSSHCFLACTGHVDITTRANLNIVKLVAGVDLFFTELSVAADKPAGKIWITSFGGTYQKEINETTRNFRINPGLFMAAPHDVASALKTVGAGSLGAIFATGQFLMMDFSTCPNGKVYLQTTNENYMIFKLTNKVNDANAKIEISADVLSGMLNQEGGEENGTKDDVENEKMLGGGSQKRRHTRRLGALRRSRTKRIYF